MTTANPFAANRPAATAPAETAPAATPAQSVDTPQFQAPPSTAPVAAQPSKGFGADPFAAPAGPGSGDKITDYLGELLIVKPIELLEQIDTSIGKADAMRADVVVLTGESQGHLSEGVLVFQTALLRDLKRILAGPQPLLLGRLGKGVAKSGKSAPFIFEAFTDEDAVLARQYLEARPM